MSQDPSCELPRLASQGSVDGRHCQCPARQHPATDCPGGDVPGVPGGLDGLLL